MATWIRIVAILIALLALFVGVSLYVSPASFIEHTDFTVKEILFLAHMWAARQIAIGLVVGYAAIVKSVPMLKITLAAYCLMNLQDVAIGIYMQDTGLAAGAAFFSLLSMWMIFSLAKSRV